VIKMNQEKIYYSVSELAKELSMSDKGIRDLIHHHKLPASKIGKAYRIKRDDFDTFWRKNQVQS